MPGGLLVTMPLPLLVTVNVNPALIANDTAFDVPPPGAGFTTVTGIVPAVAISVVVIDVVSCVALTNVVVRAVPFQRITAPDTKLVPFTARVKPGPPAVALLGASDVIVGTGLLV